MKRLISNVVLVAVCMCGTAVLGDPGIVAQTSAPAPAVRVARDLRMYGRVWPADINRDGITDLVSSGSTAGGAQGAVQVAIGNGDGTFKAPVASSFAGFVLGTGDFNGDSKPDVVAQSYAGRDGSTIVVILPGTGTAALGAPVTIAGGASDFPFALIGDFNADHHPDLVLPGGTGVDIYPGNGDFTFATPIELTTGIAPGDGIVADLNNDGRLDLVTANVLGSSLSVFLNQGSFVFTAADIPLGLQANDVTVADVNRDGHLDLLAAAGKRDDLDGVGEGEVFVFLGTGTGAFGAPAEYPVLHGPTQIVAGDFNRDGIVDVATGNQSAIVRDDCTDTWKTWDSVSILVGAGNGSFTGGRNFSIGDQALEDVSNPDVKRYRDTIVSLNTSDLNGDHATDLIASYGAILFDIPAVSNRPPTVDAGPDTVVLNTHEVVLRPRATDPDQDVLTWEIRDDAGKVIATYPNACDPELHDGANTFTVTVDDGHGHTATDTVVYTVTMTTGVGAFAQGNDVGTVAAAGSESYDAGSGTYTVKGDGADIWGTSDQFHYVWTELERDAEITVFVKSIQNVNAWTKAGLMIRENLNPGARHASLFATPGKGIAFQRRTVENGASVNTAGPQLTAPVWLRLSRHGDTVFAYYRKTTTDLWTKVGEETLSGLGDAPLAGLAVTSHVSGTLATATFTNVSDGIQPAWTGSAVGTGSGALSSWDGTVMTIKGQGADIWGAADAFYYVHSPWSGDVTITARVRSVTNTDVWTKAGVMFRESLDAGSKHVMAVVTPGKGVAMQYRAATGGASANAQVAGSAPGWVRITRRGQTFTAYWSNDFATWTTIGSVTIAMNFDLYIGLPVTSHNASATATALFDDIIVSP
jgi:hypothetical protein